MEETVDRFRPFCQVLLEMKIGISLPKEIVDWLRRRKTLTGVPISRQILDAINRIKNPITK